MYPSSVALFKWWDGETWWFIVKKLSVDSPPLFRVAWKLSKLSFEFVLVVAVGRSESCVSVFLCFVVVWLSVCELFL